MKEGREGDSGGAQSMLIDDEHLQRSALVGCDLAAEVVGYSTTFLLQRLVLISSIGRGATISFPGPAAKTPRSIAANRLNMPSISALIATSIAGVPDDGRETRTSSTSVPTQVTSDQRSYQG